MSPAGTGGAARAELVVLAGAGTAIDDAYASDWWDPCLLGVDARRGDNRPRFDTIVQPWLREAAKSWCRFRLATGCAFGTVVVGASSLSRFSRFLHRRHPGVAGGPGLTRSVLVDYLSWLASSDWSITTRFMSLTTLRVFIDHSRRHGWLPGLAADAVIYEEELPRRTEAVPRFIPEFVMTQLESESALAVLATPTLRNLVVVLMETGLRSGDACELVFDPMLDDSVGWPCLRFNNSKVRIEQLIPLSAKAASAIRAQQDLDRARWPAGTPWLFPGLLDNEDGSKPYARGSLSAQLRRWQAAIDLRDEAGESVRVNAHRFRHTVGTRLINAGVPQHVVQKLLGHASPRMTGTYAALHDSTVRQAFDHYQAQRVDTAGKRVAYDPDATTASAEWVKHNLARIRDTLPNGYCGRPAQQDCPHPNACLTCPDFQTTPEFLDVHRRHAGANRTLIATADSSGQFRLASNLRMVQDSLERIIPALEAIEDADRPDHGH
ncbi:MAG TPA: tyrosine-type recombinase/integrase [Acidimicrobiales bacterium]|jgi:integrase|nr:tyrosine-type recombinase/integrase [Acidimicrobiales bacterium]